mmetsp:Transcript_14254/g.29482  ORF Transcript_14254/g.29482 Transcript_14254/m.29482 type:complete len:221 (-) Transcript_14254:63-725(-)
MTILLVQFRLVESFPQSADPVLVQDLPLCSSSNAVRLAFVAKRVHRDPPPPLLLPRHRPRQRVLHCLDPRSIGVSVGRSLVCDDIENTESRPSMRPPANMERNFGIDQRHFAHCSMLPQWLPIALGHQELEDCHSKTNPHTSQIRWDRKKAPDSDLLNRLRPLHSWLQPDFSPRRSSRRGELACHYLCPGHSEWYWDHSTHRPGRTTMLLPGPVGSTSGQ